MLFENINYFGCASKISIILQITVNNFYLKMDNKYEYKTTENIL